MSQRPQAHIPKVLKHEETPFCRALNSFFFDLAALFANIVVHIFFREVSTRGSFNLPKKGSTIVVVAPHGNQFMDGAIMMTQIKGLTHRKPAAIIAASSYNTKFVGFFAKLANSIPVARAQDNLKFVEGQIYIKEGQEDLTKIYGKGTHFTELGEKGLLGLPESAGNTDIQKILSDTELILRKPFKSDKATKLLLKGTKFKYAEKISNDETFQYVFDALHGGRIITIFPEGGSHDRPDLLPIKAGFAIMALGAVAADPSHPVEIIPTGLNYFHRNKFRSRAVVEFGTPITVTAEHGEAYKKNPREAVAKLLDETSTALRSVTVSAPDFETLQVIQAARRLYKNKIPISLVVDMNRKLLTGYTHYKDDPRIIHLKDAVIKYNKRLNDLGLKDHQVELATDTPIKNFTILIYRVLKLSVLVMLSLPGTILFAPIFVVTDRISAKKQKEALAASVVKIKAIDVVASWKIIVATIFAPSLYITYSITGTILTRTYDFFGFGSTSIVYLFVLNYIVLVSMTYAAFVIGESGLDIFKSLPPLVKSVFSSKDGLKTLKETRKKLSLEVTEVVNLLGPKVFPDFDIFAKKNTPINKENELKSILRKKHGFQEEGDNDRISISRTISRSSSVSSSIGLSRVNSEGYLSDVPILGNGGDDYCSSASSRSFASSDYDRIVTDLGEKDDGDDDVGLKLRTAMRNKFKNVE